MRALSTDLRCRAVDAYRRGEGSQADIARRFAITDRTLRRWLRRRDATGALDPAPHAGGRPPAVREGDRALITGWLADEPDLTQQALAERFSAQTGRPVSQQGLSRGLRRLAITRKKRP
jgi:transposase